MRTGRDRLTDALRDATVALSVPAGPEGTGFLVAPGLVLTCAHVIADRSGSGKPPDFVAASSPGWPSELKPTRFLDARRDLALLQAAGNVPGIPALMAEQVDPGDELWAFGYPAGQYRGGEPVAYRYDGPAKTADGRILLRATQGAARPGHSGSPVLNWRTGAVCGVIRLGSTGEALARLIPVNDIMAAFPELAIRPPWTPQQREWLDLLDDKQLRAAGFRYAGPRLRAYLHAARTAAREHPYRVLEAAPPLSEVYLRQRAARHLPSEQDTEISPVKADALLEHHRGAQVIGGPGAGKSSLLRYITDVSAGRWLDGRGADYVPVRIAADALSAGRTLPDSLAAGVASDAGATITDSELAGLFAQEPVADVPWLVLVDGVDEILDQWLRRRVLDAIGFHRGNSPGYRFIVTSRPLPDAALRRLDGDETPAYDIEPFDYQQLPQFAAGWFNALSLPAPEMAVARFTAQLETSRLQQLARVPLIATMMCVVFADSPEQVLPPSRAELYEKFVGRLLDKQRWPLDARRRLHDRVSSYGPAAVQACDRLLEDLRLLLHELADYRQRGERGTLLGRAIDLKRSQMAPGFPAGEWDEVIREVLRQSGVLVERSGDFSFVHQSIQEYLAACCRAARDPKPAGRRAGWLPPTWETWPWKDAEVTIFLAEIWISRGKDLSRPLKRLMRRRNRAANAPFIAELAAHGAALPTAIRERATDALAGTLKDRATSQNDWLAAARHLTSLDRTRAVQALTELVRGRESAYRRVEAARIVLGIDTGRGLPLIESIVVDSSADSSDRLRAARSVAEADRARGLTSFRLLAEDPAIDQYGHLEGARALGELDRGLAVEVLSGIATDHEKSLDERIDALHALGQLGYARDVRPADRAQAIELLSRFAAVAATDDCIRAARAIGELDKEQAVAVLERRASDVRAPLDNRIPMLRVLGEFGHSPSLETLALIATDQQVQAVMRFQASRVLAEFNRERAMDILAATARDASAAMRTQIEACKVIAELDKDRGITLLEGLAKDGKLSGSRRIQAAAALYRLDRQRGQHAFVAIASDRRLASDVRIKAASELEFVDHLRFIGLLRGIRSDLDINDPNHVWVERKLDTDS